MPADMVQDKEQPSRPGASDPFRRGENVSEPSELISRIAGGPRGTWLICALLVVTTFAIGTFVIWQQRQTAFRDTERELTNLGVVLAEQTSRTVQSVDIILQEVQTHVATLDARSPEQYHQQLAGADTVQFLAERLRNVPQAEAIVLIDGNGGLLNWSRASPLPQLNFSDREYFRYLSTHDSTGPYFSVPVESKVTGEWVIVVARRINGPDGAFRGLVIGLVDAKYLEDFYQTISMVPGEYVTLLRRDGVVIAGYPSIADRRGKLMPKQSPWYDRVAGGGGSYLSPGYLSPVVQIITVHPLRDYPLVVDVNMAEEAALASWRRETIAVVIATTSVAIGFTVLFTVIAAQFRRLGDQNRKLEQHAAALRESETKLKAYAEMSADWFWEQDADLRFLNDANIPLTSLPTDIGKTRWDVADTAMDPGRWDTHKADLAARRKFRDFRWERIRTDGSRRYLSTSGDPIFNEAGEFLGYHGTGRDVTADVEAAEELRLAKDRAEAASRAKTAFLANMSHELRTPLNAIIGFSELLHEQKTERANDNQTEWSGEILSSAHHLLEIINDVLEISRIEAGGSDLRDETVDVATTARACLSMIRLKAEENSIRLDCPIVNSSAVLRADSRAVKQVLLNLVTNAVKFTPAGGHVSVRTETAANGDLVIVVADSGIGIDPAVLALLCEPFTQADDSIRRKYGGTGLGLAISRKLIVLHGGDLSIDSALGQGTTVRISFPAERVIVEPRAADAATEVEN